MSEYDIEYDERGDSIEVIGKKGNKQMCKAIMNNEGIAFDGDDEKCKEFLKKKLENI